MTRLQRDLKCTLNENISYIMTFKTITLYRLIIVVNREITLPGAVLGEITY